MRYEQFISEDDIIDELTNWQIQKQFGLSESFDTDVKLTIQGDCKLYHTSFYVAGVKYRFTAKEETSNLYHILFYPIGNTDEMFKLQKSKSYVGMVFAGVFKSLKSLIDTCNVQKFMFSADNKELERLYTCLLYTSPSPRDRTRSRMPSSA